MTTLVEMVLAIDAALRSARVPHAFGGALALAFHIDEPRGTRDIDLNCFVPATRARTVFESLPAAIAWSAEDVATVERDGQVRVFWNDTPVDLFFSTHPFHEHAAANAEDVPFDGTTIRILSATDLAVFKAFFDRTRDWADIEAMVDAGTVELHEVIGWIVDLIGAGDRRVDRLTSLLRRVPPSDEPRFAP
jgi:hypothetical protein